MKTTLFCLSLAFYSFTSMAQQTTETGEIRQATSSTELSIPVKKESVPTESLLKTPKTDKKENQIIEPKKTVTRTRKATKK